MYLDIIKNKSLDVDFSKESILNLYSVIMEQCDDFTEIASESFKSQVIGNIQGVLNTIFNKALELLARLILFLGRLATKVMIAFNKLLVHLQAPQLTEDTKNLSKVTKLSDKAKDYIESKLHSKETIGEAGKNGHTIESSRIIKPSALNTVLDMLGKDIKTFENSMASHGEVFTPQRVAYIRKQLLLRDDDENSVSGKAKEVLNNSSNTIDIYETNGTELSQQVKDNLDFVKGNKLKHYMEHAKRVMILAEKDVEWYKDQDENYFKNWFRANPGLRQAYGIDDLEKDTVPASAIYSLLRSSIMFIRTLARWLVQEILWSARNILKMVNSNINKITLWVSAAKMTSKETNASNV